MLFDSSEHEFLPIPFIFLTLCGSWCPENWTASKKRIYGIYTITISSLGIILIIEVLINIILTIGTENFNLENIFVFNTFCNGMLKLILVTYERNKIFKFMRYCAHQEEWHKPRNSAETSLQRIIHNELRLVSVSFAVLFIMSIILRAVQPIIDAATLIVLPLDAWYPYSIDNFFLFTVTYFHQLICGVLMTSVHVGSDILFVSLMIQIKYHLMLLALRLTNLKSIDTLEINKYKKTNFIINLKHVIMHNVNSHEKIYRSSKDFQAAFNKVAIGQTIFFIPNLIFSGILLSVYTDRLSVKYFMTFFFFVVALIVVYMFCWYGNEIIVGCSDISCALYECDWISLDKSTKQLLMLIFIRSTQPIIITAATIFPYDLTAFIKIMKSAYTAFNLLQQTVHE